jgi:hypothetical protein
MQTQLNVGRAWERGIDVVQNKVYQSMASEEYFCIIFYTFTTLSNQYQI